MADDYEFVRMSEAYFDDFSRLAENAFGVRLSKKEIQGLFDTAQWKKKFIAYMAFTRESNEAVAFFGLFPCLIECEGRKYQAAQAGSAMTHSDHRKKGLFNKTAKLTLDLARDEGIVFAFAFPNSRSNLTSYPGFMKMKWTHDGEMNGYHLAIPTLPVANLFSRFKALEIFYSFWFRFITSFWKIEYSPLSFAPSPRARVCHDELSLAYKSQRENRIMIRIGKSKIWINHFGGRVGIGDMEMTGERKDFLKTMRGLRLLCFLLGSFHLRTYVSPGSPLDRLFQANGFTPRKGNAICYFDLNSGLPLDRLDFVYADFDTF